MDLQKTLGIGQKSLPSSRQSNPAPAAMQETLTKHLLEPLHLHGHCRLGSSDLDSGRAQRPGMGGVDKSEQKPKVYGRLHINSYYI